MAATQAVTPWKPATVGPVGYTDLPLESHGLVLLDEVIAAAETATGLRFSAYLGDLGTDTRATAESLLDGLGADAPYAVLVAISPGQRAVEIVTGAAAARRLTDRGSRLAVLNVVSRAADGDLLGALTNGIRTLADQAGILPERSGW
ncbi:DUF5130 family protein [Nakamurella alba]|uniref:DUF5130 family protein n=1 Tax=Nakamurella alba TaxID=2665158 RepID=UPI002AC348D5|nr:DUF5130 family protein [Nakamurella alba]